MLPAIGSVSTLAGQGRSGVVVSAQPIGEAEDGRQLVALKVRESVAMRQDGGSQTVHDRSGPVDITSPSQAQRRADVSAPAARLPEELNAAEKADVTRLQQRDQQVRQEEKAHATVAGDLAGPISYVYQRGPDGRNYAVGGSVGIQASNLSGDPEEAKRISSRIAAAANAATNPSAQDYAIAREAYAFGSQLTPRSSEDARTPELSVTA